MLTLVVFIPSDNKERLKQALFAAGAGNYDGYDQCCFEMEGTGQFRPLVGSNPSIGKKNQVEHVKETRIEVLVNEDKINQVVKSLKENHPYEVPAYYIYKHFQLPESPIQTS